MRWPKPIYAIMPFVYILVGGAVLYRGANVIGIFAGTVLIGAGAIILQMRHDYQHRPRETKNLETADRNAEAKALKFLQLRD